MNNHDRLVASVRDCLGWTPAGLVPEVPRDVEATLTDYIQTGVPMGGFLTAVVENDLANAVGRADAQNAAALRSIVMWIYNEAPSACWGSKEKVRAWIYAHEEIRRTDAQRIRLRNGHVLDPDQPAPDLAGELPDGTF